MIFGIKEKKNPNEFMREHEERELAKTDIKRVQDSTQKLDQEEDTVKGVGDQ
ncbi:hypothetical protein E2C01_028643 [Portunus trituberculatus]|uniref:Uncharacterized protein n=1 Tax=Portunus trituberculatus TaxID=210409 RepID=A0A5B7ESA1_PORTR|nr:hypothetical protein [Portunus trituberculatus]